MRRYLEEIVQRPMKHKSYITRTAPSISLTPNAAEKPLLEALMQTTNAIGVSEIIPPKQSNKISHCFYFTKKGGYGEMEAKAVLAELYNTLNSKRRNYRPINAILIGTEATGWGIKVYSEETATPLEAEAMSKRQQLLLERLTEFRTKVVLPMRSLGQERVA